MRRAPRPKPKRRRLRADAEATKRQADAELARARADAESSRAAKAKADADAAATKMRAQAEADAARIRADAEAAAARTKSDAEAAARATRARPPRPREPSWRPAPCRRSRPRHAAPRRARPGHGAASTARGTSASIVRRTPTAPSATRSIRGAGEGRFLRGERRTQAPARCGCRATSSPMALRRSRRRASRAIPSSPQGREAGKALRVSRCWPNSTNRAGRVAACSYAPANSRSSSSDAHLRLALSTAAPRSSRPAPSSPPSS